jgi:hypothetical protein
MNAVEAYLKLPWSFCEAYGKRSTLVGCVSPARLRSFKREGALKRGASDMLILLPGLSLFPDDRCPEWQAFARYRVS